MWLLRRKPELYQKGPFSDFMQKIVTEGYAIEEFLKSYLSSQEDRDKYSYQTVFETSEGLLAGADCTLSSPQFQYQ